MNNSIVSKILYFLKILSTYALDTVAPPDPLVRKIELMSPREFRAVALPPRSGGALPNIHSVFNYKDPFVKAAILEIKSYGNKKLAQLLGAVLFEYLSSETTLDPHNPTIIIPIPITQKSLRARGWNQCELIGHGIAYTDTHHRFNVCFDILYKHRETGDQVGKNRTERFENLRNSFSVSDPSRIVGETIVVFDDILTTGATLSEARRALIDAGASRVICIALAH